MLGGMYAQLLRDVAGDPDLGPDVAARIERVIRDRVRRELLEIVPEAWDLLRPECWPTRRQ